MTNGPDGGFDLHLPLNLPEIVISPQTHFDPAPDWDRLRQAFAADPGLRQELEMYGRIVVENFNPSGRAARFVYGALCEWGLALAGFAAGLLALPDGHDADGHDLRGVVEQQRGLWSVKASASTSPAYDFILQNFRAGVAEPPPFHFPVTVFMHPVLPGITMVDPDRHPNVVAAVETRRDCRVLPLRVLVDHTDAHPECVIPFQQPGNPGGAGQDDVTGLDLVRGVVDSIHFTRLKMMFQQAAAAEAGDIVTRVRDVQQMIQAGVVTQEQGQRMIDMLLGA